MYSWVYILPTVSPRLYIPHVYSTQYTISAIIEQIDQRRVRAHSSNMAADLTGLLSARPRLSETLLFLSLASRNQRSPFRHFALLALHCWCYYFLLSYCSLLSINVCINFCSILATEGRHFAFSSPILDVRAVIVWCCTVGIINFHNIFVIYFHCHMY